MELSWYKNPDFVGKAFLRHAPPGLYEHPYRQAVVVMRARVAQEQYLANGRPFVDWPSTSRKPSFFHRSDIQPTPDALLFLPWHPDIGRPADNSNTFGLHVPMTPIAQGVTCWRQDGQRPGPWYLPDTASHPNEANDLEEAICAYLESAPDAWLIREQATLPLEAAWPLTDLSQISHRLSPQGMDLPKQILIQPGNQQGVWRF